jgi:hypothetical protein
VIPDDQDEAERLLDVYLSQPRDIASYCETSAS